MNHKEWTDTQNSATVVVDGHDQSVAYYDSGSGTPVVFLHGIPTWSFLWRDVTQALKDDYRVIAPDLLGYGNSSKIDNFDRSLRAQEAMLDAFLNELGIKSSVLVGHDIGGGIALRFSWHKPEHVDGLVLSNSACYDSWPVEFINGLGIPGTVTGLEDDELDKTLDFVFSDGLHDDAPHEEFAAGMKAPWQSAAGRTSLERCAVATNTNHTTEIDYEAITADTLLLWGHDDVLQTVSYAERLATDLNGCTEIVTLNRAYHWVTEDRPDAYADHLRDFLDSTSHN